jgi:formylglycine-generating enzyme required for sulfatase activity
MKRRVYKTGKSCGCGLNESKIQTITGLAENRSGEVPERDSRGGCPTEDMGFLRWVGSGWWMAVIAIMSLLLSIGCGKSTTQSGKEGQTSAAPNPLVPLTNMVQIHAGSFVRGKFTVTVSRDFWLGKYEVTQGEFSGLMGKNPSHFQEGCTNCPVEKISNFDAMAYCAELTKRERQAGRLPDGYEYRLPTEAEWEYACRAGTTNRYSFGDETSVADQYAWTAENSEGKPHPVGQKKPNPWGLYDIHGNVWEWCLDYFEGYPLNDVTDPTGPGPTKFKVFRGGSWNHDIEMARSGNRFMMAPANGIFFVGFRVALSQTAGQ